MPERNATVGALLGQVKHRWIHLRVFVSGSKKADETVASKMRNSGIRARDRDAAKRMVN